MLKNDKGVTLVAMIIMIIILAIMASVAIVNGRKNVQNAMDYQKEKNFETVRAMVNEISLKRQTAGSLSPANMILYGKSVSSVPEIASRIQDSSLEGWYVLEEDDLKEMGIDYFNEVYAVNYDKNEIKVFADYLNDNTENLFSVHFNPNGGTLANTTIKVGAGNQLGTLPTPERNNYIFIGWYTERNAGTEITEDTIVEEPNITYYAHWTNGVAEMNGVYYTTLQEAINNVQSNNTPHRIKLLKSVSEALTVANNKNIEFDLQNFTISNKENTNVIINNGTISISNGTIASDAPTNGAINNESGAILYLSGGRINVTGGRQAVYNNGGTLHITGDAKLSTTTSARATVQNLANGKIYLTGGTLISTGSSALQIDTGTVTIGDKSDGIVTDSPILQGATYAIFASANFYLYDGTILGKKEAIFGEDKAILEEGYHIAHSTDTAQGTIYQLASLSDVTVIVAMIGNRQYDSLQRAINDVPKDNTETTIRLLENHSTNATIEANQNVVLEMQGLTLSGLSPSAEVINNKGTLSIHNGTITSSFPVAVYNKGTFNLSGGNIESEGEANDSGRRKCHNL